MSADKIATDTVDQRTIRERGVRHNGVINAPLIIRKPLSLIEIHSGRLLIRGMADVGFNIRKRVDEMGISQIELAQATGLSAQRLNNYIQGKRPPDIDSLARIAKALRVTTDSLLGLNDSGQSDIRAVILRLLELDGMALPRAEAIADASSRALQLLSSLPAGGEARTRALMAAQAAWQTRPPAMLS